ncbi:MAG: tRNA (adenosine(37)-N6)-threonylcarbamoyltransferase complex transferase subunit TsaD [Verrucomicrobiota bacterium JB023]|nr:tRNA (adenosine(37)-N6)-threonylcarbamoyltransferase complex transferase subunit TsaD [Verrucomicrobiota bacterium JB023]
MRILAIESSCDETAVAIYGNAPGHLPDHPALLTSLVSSQIDIHRLYGGVVPEVASRNHTLRLQPLVTQALADAGLSTDGIDAFAATGGPGLASSLLVGHSFAKGLAVASGKPFLSINHMEGHLLSPFLAKPSPDPREEAAPAVAAPSIPPHLALIVSGGHTMLVKVEKPGHYTLLGRTIDDAAGEAFDKVGRMLNLPYPGGPEIEKLAHQGDPSAFDFPRSLLKDPSLDFSFSGLKTAVLYTLQKLPNPAARLADICASFQAAVFEVLISKSLRAARESGLPLIALSGGVSCNATLRKQMEAACQEAGLEFRSAIPSLSTDNAAMIAFAGWHRHHGGHHDPLSTDINPNLALCPA